MTMENKLSQKKEHEILRSPSLKILGELTKADHTTALLWNELQTICTVKICQS